MRDTPFSRFLEEFRRNKVAAVAAVIVSLIVFIALIAPLITPQDPYDLAHLLLRDARRPPGYVGTGGYIHWLGTDSQGRDLLSAIIYGLRISLQMGVIAGGIALVIGAVVGCAAAYIGGRFESLVMRIVDLSFRFRRSCPPSSLPPFSGKAVISLFSR